MSRIRLRTQYELYEGLNITRINSTPDLDSCPAGETVVLMTDEHAYNRPVLFDGFALGGRHFLEARLCQGRLEVISMIIHPEYLDVASAEDVGLVDTFLKGLRPNSERKKLEKAAAELAGLFDYSASRNKYRSLPGEWCYETLFGKVERVGLVKWVREHPYEEMPVVSGSSAFDQEAE